MHGMYLEFADNDAYERVVLWVQGLPTKISVVLSGGG